MRNLLLVLLLISTGMVYAQKEYHVSTKGNDSNDGSVAKPYNTIQAAANVANPGDVITVHEGIYHESIDPPRGGNSENLRITYQAAPGEKVVISGSEPISGWVKVTENTWKVTLPNSYFGNFNPYCDRIRGDWYDGFGRINHTGSVYVNGDWIMEAGKLEDVIQPEGKEALWFAIVDGAKNEGLLNFVWFKPENADTVSAFTPSLRYGTKPARCNDGTDCSANIYSGDYLRFDSVDFGNGSESIDFRVGTSNPNGCLIEVRLGSPQGELLGTCKVKNTGDWQKWRVVNAQIKNTRGIQNICLVFVGSNYYDGKTSIYAYFPNTNPNEAKTEISKRQTVFYPSKNFINYITVTGFTLENAAPNWAPPSSEQKAIVGTNWSKGWIIENNTIRYSKCCGVSLGKYGDGTDNTNDAGEADPYTACVKRALNYKWNKENIGSHIVRNNHIHHCEQTGIVGSMGCAFSKVYGNEIHEIHVRNLFSGAEMAGIKFHGAIDVEVKDNHIYRCGDAAGLWLDWMAQGAIVTGNLFHDNIASCGDVFFEMQHGPMVFANNILLTQHKSFVFNSKGIAIAHNLMSSYIDNYNTDTRNTPFHKAHSTEIAGIHNNAPSGDYRIYNNVVVGPCNLKMMNICDLQCYAAGNVYTKKAKKSRFDTDSVMAPGFDTGLKLSEKNGEWFLEYNVSADWTKTKTQKLITTELLGLAKIPQLPYENVDGSSLKIDTDYFGKKRNFKTPFPGPIEFIKDGKQLVKVWPK